MKTKVFKSKINTAYLVKLALLTALSYILYMFVKFPLPFMFPSFLDMQFSELPAILAGFSLGPISGVLVIVLKCLLKLPFSSTAGVGELIDIAIGIAYVLPASLIYWHKKSKKSAIIGFAVGTLSAVIVAIIFNRFVAIPFYVKLYFDGNFNIIVSICQKLYPKMTAKTFYAYYLGLAVLPFNILRSFVVSIITFLVYKRLSHLLHWEGKKLGSEQGNNNAEITAAKPIPEDSTKDSDIVECKEESIAEEDTENIATEENTAADVSFAEKTAETQSGK